MHIISFDTATKSLAISIIEYNIQYNNAINIEYNKWINYKQDITSKMNIMMDVDRYKTGPTEKDKLLNKMIARFAKLIENITLIIKNRVNIKYLDVVDIIPGIRITDTSVTYRTEMLYNFLNNVLDPIIIQHTKDINGEESSPENKVFLLEYQMGPNVKSNIISSQIIYHMTKYKSKIELVGPSLKNKVIIGGEGSRYSNFIEKYTTNYAANKNHAKHNLLELLKYMDKTHLIEHIKKKNVDDIADSVLMSIAYILKTYWN